MGREKTSNWRPDGWLLAAIEFPTLEFPTNNKRQRAVAEWFETNIHIFGRSSPCTSKIPSYFAEALSSSGSERIAQIQKSASQFALSILLAMAISAALLNNSFEHFKTLGDNESSDSRRFIQLQMTKIYELREKSILLVTVSTSIESAIRRSTKKRKRRSTTDVVSDDSFESASTNEVRVRMCAAFCVSSNSFSG